MRRFSFILFFIAAIARAETLTGVVRCQTQAVANAIVYLGVGSVRDSATNLPPVTLRQVRNNWSPRIQIARSGAVVTLRNEDPTLHIVNLDLLRGTNLPRRLLTEAMPYAGYEKAFQLEAFREPVLLKASTGNGEMAVGFVAILPHPFAALTGADGRFTINSVPPGNYRVYIWNEAYGTLTREAKVVSGRAVELAVEFPVTPAD